ncbi:hypothetical protein HYH03_018327 [Edaphochlamys debaryana]|uniref:Uncharacterized protein n=1 Tax=Edaphochlamys debaryana TaxID=47281 RepID=A0A835XGA0_9CHLO|nr:hypothetical protein HYH03_018327 [Edaphochlamys debaryana]|eukprot:KAG2482790.1 hypothetical protein HYH03_018327 [Edaphochlamys debaryana]
MLCCNSALTELSLAKCRLVDSQLELLVTYGIERSQSTWTSLSLRGNRLSPFSGGSVDSRPSLGGPSQALKADNADVKASMAEFKADVKADNADVKQQLGKAEDRWLSVAQEGYSERRLVDFLKEQQLRTLVPPADKKPELP